MRLLKGRFAFGPAGLVACLLCAASAVAAPGEPDGGFSGDGKVKVDVDPSAQNEADRIETDSAGRYVVLATADSGTGRLLRFQRDGDLDRSFGTDGVAAAPEGTWHDVALQPGGGIVLAGTSKHDFTLARLSPAGRLDPSFGEAGIATLHLDPEQPLAPDKRLEEAFERLALAPDGRIVAVGDMRAYYENGMETGHFQLGSAVARFTPTGELDGTFGNGGAISFDPVVDRPGTYGVGDLSSLAIQPDGKVLAGGNIAYDLLVVRLTATGALDKSFSGNGLARSHADTFISEGEVFHEGAALAVLLQQSGRIIAVGGETLIAFRPNGSEDLGFGPRNRNGVAPIQNEELFDEFEPSEGALDAKGRILLAGDSGADTTVSRFYPNGEHDPRFGAGGLAELNLTREYLTSSTPGERATDLVVALDGAPTTAGYVYSDEHGEPALTRFTGGDGRRATCHGKPAVLQGTPGDDRLRAYGTIVAFGGDDEIRSSWGNVCAGAGADEVDDGNLGEIYGGGGDDRITGNEVDPAYGGAGDDIIVFRKGSDGGNVFYGGSGEDLLVGGRGPDLLFGGPGRDRLIGGRGDDHLFGGPGPDEESGEGGGGRKIVYGARSKGFRVQLIVRKQRISGIHLRVRRNCSKGGSSTLWWNTNHAGIRIHPDGRFRSTTSSSSDESFSETLLAGRVMPDRIVGLYRDFERTVNATTNEVCRTGTRKHPQIEFVARSGV
jgi:uncharacterized delta-60 repeat protein